MWNWKAETLDRNLRRTRCGRGYGRTIYWTNEPTNGKADNKYLHSFVLCLLNGFRWKVYFLCDIQNAVIHLLSTQNWSLQENISFLISSNNLQPNLSMNL